VAVSLFVLSPQIENPGEVEVSNWAKKTFYSVGANFVRVKYLPHTIDYDNPVELVSGVFFKFLLIVGVEVSIVNATEFTTSSASSLGSLRLGPTSAVCMRKEP
jgi:hypothetical protein